MKMQHNKMFTFCNIVGSCFGRLLPAFTFYVMDFTLTVMSTTEPVGRSREGNRDMVRSSCEVSLPAPHLDGKRELLIHCFDQTVSSRAQVSTLTSPARCSCDLRALCTAWWEEVTRSQEQGTLSCPCNVGYFVQSLLKFSYYFSAV